MENLITILQKLSVLNRDNGHVFTDTSRLDTIEELMQGSKYKIANTDGLFRMY